MWLQRSRISWLKEGDRNTKIIQSKAVWWARNKIRSLMGSDGASHLDVAKMSSMKNEYFHSIVLVDPNLDPSAALDLFGGMMSDADNTRLCVEFSDQEISDALFQIGPLKALGLDEFHARFFQRNWAL